VSAQAITEKGTFAESERPVYCSQAWVHCSAAPLYTQLPKSISPCLHSISSIAHVGQFLIQFLNYYLVAAFLKLGFCVGG
jgi:hypothetical protein